MPALGRLPVTISVISAAERSSTPTGLPAWAASRISSSCLTYAPDLRLLNTTLPLAM